MSHHGKSTIQNNEDGVWDKRGWCGGTIIKVLGIFLVGPWQNWYLHKDKYSLLKHGLMNPSNILRWWTPTFVFSCLDYLCGDESKNIWNHQRIVMGRTSDILRQQTRAGGLLSGISYGPTMRSKLALAVPPIGNLGVLKKGPIVKRSDPQYICPIWDSAHAFASSILLSFTGLMGIPDTTKSLSLHVIFPCVWKNWLRNKSCQWDKQV